MHKRPLWTRCSRTRVSVHDDDDGDEDEPLEWKHVVAAPHLDYPVVVNGDDSDNLPPHSSHVNSGECPNAISRRLCQDKLNRR